jgi:hypothetical protein
MKSNLISSPSPEAAEARRTWARIISDLLSPPVIWGVVAFPIAARVSGSLEQTIIWGLIYTILVCILPAVYIGVMVMRGHITDMHMQVREQRVKPFLVSLLGTGLAWLVLTILGAPGLLPLFAIFTLLQIAIMLLITLYWQISMHSMSITGAVVITGALYGLVPALVLSPLIPVVGLARIRLNRHTLAQVVAGCVLGGSATLVMWLISLPLLT